MAPRVRKNIDDLTEEELANYVHALEKLQAISEADPDSIDGYTYFEQLHDGSAGPCEHANDTFLPWHRAHLWLFEEALRRSDPPRTSNVTLPYWDWSAVPTGTRYAKAFEDPQSILSHARNEQAVCRTDRPGPDCDQLPFPRSYLERDILSETHWSSAPPLTLQNTPHPCFGGVAGGESQCDSPFGLGFGKLEQPAHNSMHGGFIDGDMADPSAAALDPIFWSFHAYIDVLWWQWQQMSGHVVDSGFDSRLCGLFKDRAHQPDQRFRVKDVISPETQLDYTYEYTRRDAPVLPPLPGQLFDTHPAIDLVLSGRQAPETVRTLDVTVPGRGFAAARLNLTGVPVHTPRSYGIDVYLTPADRRWQPDDRQFRRQYLVDFLFVWKGHQHEPAGHAGHGGQETRTHNIAVDVTRAMRSLAEAHAGEPWKVWFAISAKRPSRAETLAAPAGEAAEMAALNFRDVTFEVA